MSELTEHNFDFFVKIKKIIINEICKKFTENFGPNPFFPLCLPIRVRVKGLRKVPVRLG